MAFLVALEAVGTFIVDNASTIEAVAAVASTAAGAYETRVAGIAADKQARREARLQSEQATAQQLRMKQDALTALSSQNAATLGHMGTGGPTSIGASFRRQQSQNTLDLITSAAGASARTAALYQQGTNASEAGSVGALSTALSKNGLGNEDLLSSIGTGLQKAGNNGFNQPGTANAGPPAPGQ